MQVGSFASTGAAALVKELDGLVGGAQRLQRSLLSPGSVLEYMYGMGSWVGDWTRRGDDKCGITELSYAIKEASNPAYDRCLRSPSLLPLGNYLQYVSA